MFIQHAKCHMQFLGNSDEFNKTILFLIEKQKENYKYF